MQCRALAYYRIFAVMGPKEASDVGLTGLCSRYHDVRKQNYSSVRDETSTQALKLNEPSRHSGLGMTRHHLPMDVINTRLGNYASSSGFAAWAHAASNFWEFLPISGGQVVRTRIPWRTRDVAIVAVAQASTIGAGCGQQV